MCEHDWQPTGGYLLLYPSIKVFKCVKCGDPGRIFGRLDEHGKTVHDGPVEDVMETERRVLAEMASRT